MIKNRIISFVIFSICVFTFHKVKAQTYTFTPGKVYTITLDTNQTDFGGIEVQNTGSQNLDLTWRLALKDTLIDSRFELCNSGICFLNLPNSGTMPTIAPGDIGWLKFHMYTGVVTGTNTIQYVLKNGLVQSDTLTFIIIVSNSTGIKDLRNDVNDFTMYPNPAVNETSLNMRIFKQCNLTVDILNSAGQRVYQTFERLSSGKRSINLETKTFAAGLYSVIITTENGVVTKKLSVTK